MGMDRKFKCFCLIPSSLDPKALGDAVKAAGGTPVLDLEYDSTENWVNLKKNIRYLAINGNTNNKVTLRARIEDVKEINKHILQKTDLVERLIVYISPGIENNECREVLNLVKQIIIEIDSIETAKQVECHKDDLEGIIVKGNECGGKVGEDSTFVLYQKTRDLFKNELNIYARGGIGINVAGAFRTIGASGIVLDDQLWLMPESPLTKETRKYLRNISGQEAIPLGENVGLTCRVLSKPGLKAVEQLKDQLKTIEEKDQDFNEDLKEWSDKLNSGIGWGDPDEYAWPMGQTVGLAEILAEKYKTTYNLVRAYIGETAAYLTDAISNNPLREDSELAKSHGTRYSIVQGPMTRVSDTAEFADAVSKGGALPMLALAMMRGEQARGLLEKTKALLESRSWGVGILGFAPKEIRDRQLEAVLDVKPKFALIAGGRPDQAKELEDKGIASYLHVPSPSLLKIFVEQGARRFIFEGRECGGHVGPISSLVLWERMIDVTLREIDEKYYSEISMLFAGGIHDEVSAAFIAGLTSKLAKKGCKIGVLMGTAYLFTEESVECGAILNGYQEEAIKCKNTVNLETGVGHASRCAMTPFANEFKRVRKEMLVNGSTADEIKDKLEGLSLGRLRIASKGKVRNSLGEIEDLEDQRIYNDGMYMIGQAATLRNYKTNIPKLHEEIAIGSDRVLLGVQRKSKKHRTYGPTEPSDIAVIGIGSLLPGSHKPEDFWLNIQNKVDSITEVPKERWDWRIYFNQDKAAKDKIYSKWGGFLSPLKFDPIKFGIPPKSLKSIEPLQLLTLEVVQQALEDAGYGDRNFDRENTSVIIGAGGGLADLGQQYATRSEIPRFVDNPNGKVWDRLPEWTEESFPGILLNVIAGRTANRFDLGGTNLTIDAACASSLAAIDVAVKELESGHSNLAIAGGVDTIQSPYAYYCFSKSQALSPRGKCHSFDKSADGICISEGLAILVLKRLEDAEEDGDKIYGVIKSVAGSSDGKGLGMTAPKSAGQIKAVERAYKKAGFSPATLGVYEAHGTGTSVGDRTEMQTLTDVLKKAEAHPKICSVGSAKTFVGHTKASAGVVGMVKALQSIYYKTIPPHINVKEPIDEIGQENSPIYINKNTKPWFNSGNYPRRAGVSAFGFGGTNFHAVVEEYQNSENASSGSDKWPFEIVLVSGKDTRHLTKSVLELQSHLKNNAFADISQASYWSVHNTKREDIKCLIAITSSGLKQLLEDLETVLEHLRKGIEVSLPERVCMNLQYKPQEGALALVFPGQGSQYLGMMQELASYMPEMRNSIEQLGKLLLNEGLEINVKDAIYPSSSYSDDIEKECKKYLSQTKIAQPSLAIIEIGLLDVLKRLGIKANFVAGHSFGEYTSLYASECIDREELVKVAYRRGQLMQDSCDRFDGTMLAVSASHEVLRESVNNESIFVANINSTKQTILSGPRDDLMQVADTLSAQGVSCQTLNVSGAFHSNYVKDAEAELSHYIDKLSINEPTIPVYCNSTGNLYPKDESSIRELLQKQLSSSVDFKGMIEDMHRDGAQIFLEVGPKGILSNFIGDILGNENIMARSVNEKNESSLAAFLNAICALLVKGVEINVAALFNGRDSFKLDYANNKQIKDNNILLSGGSCTISSMGSESNAKIDPLTLEDINRNKQTADTLHSNKINNSSPPEDAKLTKKGSFVQTKKTDTGYMNSNTKNTSELLIAFQSHQETMRKFLAVQESVIGKFLNPGAEAQTNPYTIKEITEPPQEVLPTSSLKDPTSTLNQTQNQSLNIKETRSVERTATPQQSQNDIQVEIKRKNVDKNIEAKPVSISSKVLSLVSDRTGYPVEMLDLDQDIEADLGIDSIKRVEIIGGLQKEVDTTTSELITKNMESITALKTLRGLIDFLGSNNTDPRKEQLKQSNSSSVSSQEQVKSANPGDIQDIVINVISERTGYPTEMLDINQDIEADLGIDSIKRVEILSSIQSILFEHNSSLIQDNMEEMTQLKSVSSLVAMIKSLLKSAGEVSLGK